MSDKGDRTRQRIVKTAAGLFSQKGFVAVTMKDLCEVCKLSRGGLYRHFGSTREIFIEVLERDKNDAEESLDQAISLGLSPKRLIDGFFQLQKDDIAYNKNRIEIAVYEFSITYPEQKDYLNERFKAAVRTFSKLIEYGQQKGECQDGNCVIMAEHIVIFLEGMKLSSKTIAFSEDFLTQQFEMLRAKIIR